MISPKHLSTRWLAIIRMTTNQREIMATVATSAALKLRRQEIAPRKAVVERSECEDVRRHTLLISFDYKISAYLRDATRALKRP